MMKSWLLSKTLWVNAIGIVGAVLPILFGYIPQEYAGYILGGLLLINIGLRWITKGELSIALPGNITAATTIPPIIQAAVNTFSKVVETLPADLGPRCMQLVDQAASNADFADNSARFEYVLETLKNEFPGVGSNILRSLIEQLVSVKSTGVKTTLAMTVTA